MARRTFYSFHYQPDNWRAAQVRNMGVIDGNQPCSDNDWETVARGGDDAIRRWIGSQMVGTSCVIVLIGAATAGRKWITYEIIRGWNERKGVVGVYVHNLQDRHQQQSGQGANPFANIRYNNTAFMLSSIVKAYDPPYSASTQVYGHIRTNLASWVEEAIAIRSKY